MDENKNDDDIIGKQPGRLKRWVHNHKKLAAVLSILIVILLGTSIATMLYLMQPKATPAPVVIQQEPAPAPPPPKFYSPLTGLEVKDEAATKQAVTAIMIENSPDSRPQSGLKNSGVVFEAIAEGGITRFLVLYQQEKPKLIGPVRSVRMYYVDWLAAFNASVAHIGGSAAALREVRNGSYRDIDQFFNSAYYWRATDRYAPHNVYTSFEKLDALNKKKGYTTSEFTGFARKDSEPADEPTATKINVKISSATYNSTYNYDPKTNTYKRTHSGTPHRDREQGQIMPRVVVVMKVPMKRVFEDGWREQIATIGSGPVTIFQDGLVFEGTWKKSAKTKQITFTDKDGEVIELARGQTWITAVPNTTGGVSWQ